VGSGKPKRHAQAGQDKRKLPHLRQTGSNDGRSPHGVAKEQAVRKLVNQPQWLQTLLGEYMTQAKSGVWFDGEGFDVSQGVALDRRTRMMYDKRQIYINGDSFRVRGADARLLRQLADDRRLGAAQVARLSADAQMALQDWADNGWLK